ncbi:MAG: triose-phosphate isomerase [SAR202 cluster bacterium]|nr:triose-phosphate isomerase [SAR202 cluster bacterium]
MPSTIIAGNWKMNTTLSEARELVARMRPGLDSIGGVDKVVCPPFISLAAVRDSLQGSTIRVGAQNVYPEPKGAFTGEVSPAMLSGLCEYVIIGHSERRHILGETDALIARKVEAALKAGLRPILCVGERLQEREQGRAEAVVEEQLRLGLEKAATLQGIVIAYEPVWAIGTGKAATKDDAQSMMAFIRGWLSKKYGVAAGDTSLLYGGSVNAGNVVDFMRQKDVNGALVGGASLDAAGFVELTRNAASVKK